MFATFISLLASFYQFQSVACDISTVVTTTVHIMNTLTLWRCITDRPFKVLVFMFYLICSLKCREYTASNSQCLNGLFWHFISNSTRKATYLKGIEATIPLSSVPYLTEGIQIAHSCWVPLYAWHTVAAQPALYFKEDQCHYQPWGGVGSQWK